MSHKIKSITYLSCFVFSTIIYAVTMEDSSKNFPNDIETVETKVPNRAYEADSGQQQ